MLQTLRVLRAAVLMHEFTIEELAAQSQVPVATVRTVLRRHEDMFEVIGSKATGRRGGQWTIYRVPSETADTVAALVEQHRHAAGPPLEPSLGRSDRPMIAERLGALEHRLLTGPAPTASARRDRLARAVAEVESLRPGVEASSDRPLVLRHRAADLLARTLLADWGTVDDAEIQRVRRQWGRILGQLDDAGLGQLAGRMVDRTRQSSFPDALGIELPQVAGRYAVGVELRPYRFEAVLTDGRGQVVATRHTELDGMDVGGVVDALADTVDDLLCVECEVRPPNDRVVFGIQLFGPVDTDSGLVHFMKRNLPPHRPEVRSGRPWRNVPLGELLRQATGLRIVVENDANAFAVREQWFGVGRETPDFAVVLIREGIGGSVVAKGELFAGPVEIGQFIVHLGGLRLIPDLPGAAIEGEAGITAILEAVAETTEESVSTIERAVELGERKTDKEKVMAVFTLSGSAIALGAAYLTNFAGPTHLVVCGPDVLFDDRYAAATTFKKRVERFDEDVTHEVFRDCTLVFRPVTQYDGAQAAALVALQRGFEISPTNVLARADEVVR